MISHFSVGVGERRGERAVDDDVARSRSACPRAPCSPRRRERRPIAAPLAWGDRPSANDAVFWTCCSRVSARSSVGTAVVVHRAALAERLGDDLAEHLDAAEPLLGILVARARDDLVDLRVRAGHDLARPRPAALERCADQCLVEQRTDRVDIAAASSVTGPVAAWTSGATELCHGTSPALHRGDRPGAEREVDDPHAPVAADDDRLVGERAVLDVARAPG